MGDVTFQAGLGLGYGQTRYDQSYPNLDLTADDKSKVMQAYLLARNPLFGGEVGFLKLPEYHSLAKTNDYRAYKGTTSGPETARVTQDITASAPYARLNVYGPKVMGAEPYIFGGKARVTSDNHENAIYDQKDENDFRETMKKMATYYGLGIDVLLSKNMHMRAEYGRIPGATVGPHTGNRDMSMGTLGLGFNF